jgi:hypothetical protein
VPVLGMWTLILVFVKGSSDRISFTARPHAALEERREQATVVPASGYFN